MLGAVLAEKMLFSPQHLREASLLTAVSSCIVRGGAVCSTVLCTPGSSSEFMQTAALLSSEAAITTSAFTLFPPLFLSDP